MNGTQQTQFRLDTRAQAFADAVTAVERSDRDLEPLEELERLAKNAKAAAERFRHPN